MREHCESTGDTPYAALEKLAAGTLSLPHVQALIDQFNAITGLLADLEPLKDDVPKLIEELFPGDVEAIAELRELAAIAKRVKVIASNSRVGIAFGIRALSISRTTFLACRQAWSWVVEIFDAAGQAAAATLACNRK